MELGSLSILLTGRPFLKDNTKDNTNLHLTISVALKTAQIDVLIAPIVSDLFLECHTARFRV